MDIAKLKAKARKNLTGNYGTMILVLLVFIVLSLGSSLIATLINVRWIFYGLMLIASSLLAMELVGMIVKISKKKKVKFDDLFSQTDLALKYAGITIILWIIGFLFSLLEFIAFKSLVVIMAYNAELNMIFATVLICIGLLLSVGILVAGIYISIAFSQVLFILYDEPKMSIRNVLSKSFDMMSDNTLEYFILCLSFIGWIILGAFTFGILYFWLIPYMLVTFANFYNVIKKQYEEVSGNPEPFFTSVVKSDDEIETLF